MTTKTIDLAVDAAIRTRMKAIGKLGGIAAAQALTARQRTIRAQKAALARWRKRNGKP